MKITHVPIHPDLAYFVMEGIKTQTRRPLKVQPYAFDDSALYFGSEELSTKIYIEDYVCPYGSTGDLIIFYFEGNPHGFYEGKLVNVRLERLSQIKTEDVIREGFETTDNFFAMWDLLYGESEAASFFDPVVWVIEYKEG